MLPLGLVSMTSPSLILIRGGGGDFDLEAIGILIPAYYF